MLKKRIDSGRFGTLTLGGAYIKWYRPQAYYDSGGWRGTWKLDGGGALMNQSIHATDLFRYFMGPVKAVQAHDWRMNESRSRMLPVTALRFENGALGVIEGATAVYPGFLKRIEISGSNGTIVLPLEQETLT